MNLILFAIQITLSVAVILLILVQSRTAGLSRSFSGGGASFTRRGLEKLIFRATFVFSILFLLFSIIILAL
ncbi:preprotein translocase subunit SecG [Candidatus Woesebacteria bacterium RIFCSPHIGHO2_01_FULL_38_9b]|uniref:Protein-export membrane protein SecG n=1 Tax=Candidatus Woesebacteria bacterium RIFCSPHIGHO2_01_FULL_38_9b TaxID=1802493 RepID=A0A1F7XYK9_9BACT|nr:MAG: preprotein translocase subunit SecG [Candidatus Woesebacteria bacterium RIFCSPHIGHO2_01_FULL_38_9b]